MELGAVLQFLMFALFYDWNSLQDTSRDFNNVIKERMSGWKCSGKLHEATESSCVCVYLASNHKLILWKLAGRRGPRCECRIDDDHNDHTEIQVIPCAVAITVNCICRRLWFLRFDLRQDSKDSAWRTTLFDWCWIWEFRFHSAT